MPVRYRLDDVVLHASRPAGQQRHRELRLVAPFDAPSTQMRRLQLYFPGSMAMELRGEAARLNRSLSLIFQCAWKLARPELRALPGMDDVKQPHTVKQF